MNRKKEIKKLQGKIKIIEARLENAIDNIDGITNPLKYEEGEQILDLIISRTDFYTRKYYLINKKGETVELFEEEIDDMLKIK